MFLDVTYVTSNSWKCGILGVNYRFMRRDPLSIAPRYSVDSDSHLTNPSDDKLNRAPFAKRVAEVLATRTSRASISVAIDGHWGEGKTSVLHFIHYYLGEYKDVVAVWFNPWRFSDEAALLMSFFSTLAALMDRSPELRREKIGKVLLEYGSVVTEVSALSGVGGVLPKIGKALAKVPLEERKKRIQDLLDKSGKRFVVFLDDIDRLDKKSIRSIFRLLKLTADFGNISYVLALDRTVVAEAIGGDYGDGAGAGQHYLEKIIQLNLGLPAADPTALSQIFQMAAQEALRIGKIDLTLSQQEEFRAVVLGHIEPVLRSPRMIKLYANAVEFSLPLLANEVNPIDVLVLEWVRICYPPVFEHMRRAPDLFTGDFDVTMSLNPDKEKILRNRLTNLLESFGSLQRERIEQILKRTFPQLRGAFESGKYANFGEQQARKEQRVSIPEYLLRYLAGCVPESDIADEKISSLLKLADTGNDQSFQNGFLTLVSAGKQDLLLAKLAERVVQLSASGHERLCIGVARQAHSLSYDDGSWISPRDRAGYVIATALRNVAVNDRLSLAKRVLLESKPLAFAAICLRSVRDETMPEVNRLFPNEQLEELGEFLADRVAEVATNGAYLDETEKDWLFLLWNWQRIRGSEPVRQHLGQLLCTHPDRVRSLLQHYATTEFGPRISRTVYEKLCELVDPADVIHAIDRLNLLDNAQPSPVSKLAQQFVDIHSNPSAI